MTLPVLAALAATAIGVQGEAPAHTNIPVAASAQASGGQYLALDTARPPGRRGWFATYRVTAPAAGAYRLDAVVTPPAMADRRPAGGSYFSVSVNGSPFAEVARSEPVWADAAATPSAWGSLVRARLDDVELRRGSNTIAFRVDARRVSVPPAVYRFLLDRFTLRPTRLRLARVYVGDPARNLGVTREARPRVTFAMNGRVAQARAIGYRVVDYFGSVVATGSATITAGASAGEATLPALGPGHYRVEAAGTAGSFALLPEQRPVTGPANRFGVTVSTPWLVAPSQRAALSAAVKEMGAGYVRDELSWPVLEPRRGHYDTRPVEAAARTFGVDGIRTLGALWSLAGNLKAPDWATTRASRPLPEDLRDGYALARRLARGGPGALELWNEPDVDVIAGTFSRETGDQQAAYVKAAALGLVDRRDGPLAVLPGIAFPGPFQDVMLQNDVARYADVWAFHGYPDEPVASGLTPVPRVSEIDNRLRRLYGARTQMWMTEAGIFLDPTSADLTPAQQVDQARYLVQSTVVDLAAGTDKHFWFSGPPYGAGAYAFGLFDARFQPWPSYSAHAAMAALLGEANFAHALRGLPRGVRGYAFRSGERAITVLWAAAPTAVDVPVPGTRAEVYDIMGARGAPSAVAGGSVHATAALDPIYVVSDGGSALRARPTGDDTRRSVTAPSAAERIVLSQRFAADTAPAPAPFGYRLGTGTRMTLDVYNFGRRAHTVSLSARAWGGWSARAFGRRTVRVPALGRVRVPFVITAGRGVRRQVDYPLVFDATTGGQRVTPSVSRIQLRGGRRGRPVALAPSIGPVATTVAGGRVALRARIVDRLSGLDPARVELEIDGRRAASRFDAARGLLTASVALAPGIHEVWIRAINRAHAPAGRSSTVAVP